MRKTILVVDDEKLIRLSLTDCLENEGYSVTAVETGKEALESLAKDSYDLVLLDYMLPDTNGLKLLEEFREAKLGLTVIMMTSHSSLDHAVQAVHAGATDYVSKPFQDEDIILRVGRALETADLKLQMTRLRREQKKRFSLKNVVGKSPALDPVFSVVERILHAREVTVLITGESGTGKDVLAKSLHFEGPRALRPFMNITCTALPESLLESELFGHEKGSFTDARSLKKGLLELADGGTVFLDEIGDMTANLQAKLLRFLEEKTFRRVGASKDLRVDVRVIAATNKDLKAMVRDKSFREDLYFRLKVIPIHLPPLRDRTGDIPLLVEHFIEVFNKELKREVKGVTPDLLRRLERYPWPGNIRELKNTIERAMILGRGDTLAADDLPLELFDEPPEEVDSESVVKLTRRGIHLENLERDLVRQALRLTNSNQTHAARLLGLKRDQIRYRIEKFGLQRRTHDDS